MFRSIVRDNLGDSVWAKLGAGDVAVAALPPHGSYTLRLVVRRSAERGTSYWSQVSQRDDVITFAVGHLVGLKDPEAYVDSKGEPRTPKSK